MNIFINNLNIMAQNFDNLEMEHLSGYNGKKFRTIHFHPKDPNTFLYNIGGLIVIEDINDKNK